MAVVDLGTTFHFFTEDSPCVEKQHVSVPLPVKILNGEIMNSTHRVLLPSTALTRKEREAYIFPGLKNKTLLSIDLFATMGASLFFMTTLFIS